MIEQAVILSAGLGTRLRPVTETIPKVMVPVLGKPILEWHIAQYKKHGVKDFFINLHYLPDAIANFFGDGSKFGVNIAYSYEPEILGTAGGLKKFEDKLDNEFFLIFGDVFSLVDYTKMAESFYKLPEDALGSERVGPSKVADADLVELGQNLKFVKVYPKPHAEEHRGAYRLRGMCVIRKKLLSLMPPDMKGDFYKDLLYKAVSQGENFYGYECGEYSKGIDTVEKLRETEESLKHAGITDLPV